MSFRSSERVDAEAVPAPDERAGEHLVGVGDAELVAAVVAVGGKPAAAVQRAAGSAVPQQGAGGHDRVEVVVDRGVLAGRVRVPRRPSTLAEGLAVGLPGADRSVGDVELHGAGAAAERVEAHVGARLGGERGLLAVDRGDQPPVDAEDASRLPVERQVAGLGGGRDPAARRPPVVRRPGARGGDRCPEERGHGRGGRGAACARAARPRRPGGPCRARHRGWGVLVAAAHRQRPCGHRGREHRERDGERRQEPTQRGERAGDPAVDHEGPPREPGSKRSERQTHPVQRPKPGGCVRREDLSAPRAGPRRARARPGGCPNGRRAWSSSRSRRRAVPGWG